MTRRSPRRKRSATRVAPGCTRIPGFRDTNPGCVRPASRKKAASGGANGEGEGAKPERVAGARVRGTRAGGGETVTKCEGRMRNTQENFSDLAMEVACGLHNLRVAHREQ